MPFVFKTFLNHGTSHPVVARLQVQTSDLLKSTTLDEATRQAVTDAAIEASLRLVRCWDTKDKIVSECERAEREYQPNPTPQAITIPHAIGLEQDAEAFLYEAKNFLRDLTTVLNVTFGTKFDQASQFGESGDKKESKILRWSARRFGADDRLTKFFSLHQEWVTEVVRMRNAVEHPKGRSGVLHIVNYELMPKGSIRRPVWYRNDDPPCRMIDEMDGLCEQMLVMAEELGALIAEKHLFSSILVLYEIPEDQRDPACPIRFKIGLTHEEAQKLADAQTKGPAS